MKTDSVPERKDPERDDANDSPITEESTSAQRTETDIDSSNSRFTKGEKWFIVCFTAFVGLFSPLTANIYFPAIPTLSQAFHKSTELINLTVTMYLVLQGIAPMVWGPVSDHVGRRPISATCLLILSLSCIGLALVPTDDFWLLMVLRCLQASGSASTIAIGAGVVGDISSRAERGGFFGIFTIGPMVGPTIGPVIGGALAENLGWRAIFWFLTIAAAVCFIIIVLFQPETLRPIVDSGRARPIIHKPIIPLIGRNAPPRTPTSASRVKTPKNPFRLFLNVDVDILLAINALTCAVFYGVLASISSLFVVAYPFLNETTVGLSFLGIGGGMIIGSAVMGRILDLEYRKYKKTSAARFEGSSGIDFTKEESFPLEKARLRLMPYFTLLMAATCAGYGWCLEKKVNIAGPIILQFIVGFVSITVMNAASTLMIDLAPGQSSSVTACNNLTRCSLSALIVSVIDLMIKGIGIGWTYVIHCGMMLLVVPLLYLSIRVGPRYRVRRQQIREEERARMVDETQEK